MRVTSYELKNLQIKKVNPDEVVFVKLSAKGAMGEPGSIIMVSKTDNEIKSGKANFITGHYKIDKLAKVFPLIADYLSDSKSFSGWHKVNLGAGNTLFVRDDFFPAFDEQFNGKFEDEINMYWHDTAIEMLKNT